MFSRGREWREAHLAFTDNLRWKGAMRTEKSEPGAVGKAL